MTFADIKTLWAAFVLNSTRTKEWAAWADELAPVSEEKGDRTEVTEELEIELQKLQFIEWLLAMQTPSTKASNAQNRVSLKTFVDYFAQGMGVMEAHKRKSEIEAAVLKVYGARYSTTNYWLLSTLQDTAQRLKNEINRPEPLTVEEAQAAADQKDDLPF
jgi:hypothetical protein